MSTETNEATINEETKDTAETAEAAEKSVKKSDLVKRHIQAIIQQTLGVKVSKDKAWDLFKAVTFGMVELTTSVEDKSISLSGIGTFEILETKPRGSKAGLDKDGKPIEGAKVWDCVPRYRYYPSTTINDLLEQKYGFEDHGITEKHYGIFAQDDAGVADTADEKKSEKKADKPKEEKVNTKKSDIEDI